MGTRTIGNFQLIELIGEGGMGEVYRGMDTMLEREVAIKTLRPELASRPELLERFRIEAIALAKLNHPNIAAVYSFFRDGSQHHMAMQFVRGETLEKVLARRGRLPWKEAARIGIDVLQALDHAHTLGVIHRDLKPGNLMLDPSGRAVVMDFGIARVLARARQTRSGSLVGTLEYIAPELIKGADADGRADLYSLGIVLYELATGRLPFEGNTDFELMRAHTELEPPAPERFCPDLPPAFSIAILRALAKQPVQRYASAREFLAALAQAADISPALVVPAVDARRGGGSQASAGAMVQSGLQRAAAAFSGLASGKRANNRVPDAGAGPDSQAMRVTAFARQNPGVAIAAVAGVVAVGFAGAGAYQAITKPSVPAVAVKPVPKPQPVVVTPPPVLPKVEPVEAKIDGIYRMPEIPKPVVSIEGPGTKAPDKEEVARPSPPPPPAPPPSQQQPGQMIPQPVAKPPAQPRPQPTEVAKPTPKPPATPPATVVAKPPAPPPPPPATVAAKPPPPPPPPPARKEPPTPADSGWNIRR